jgi:hypothetical protein
MILEHFGTPCILPEPDIVGDCAACGGDMYDYEVVICDTGCGQIHSGCSKKCAGCTHEGCTACMIEIEGQPYCHKECKKW